MLNVVAIMGRLAADPQLRQTTTGKSVAAFRIACDRGRKDANGQMQTDWLDVVAWVTVCQLPQLWPRAAAVTSRYSAPQVQTYS